jgi:L-amino acid N-acyltransferase YncA
MNYVIADMTAEDWEAVRSIYLEGIATGLATFETDAPGWEKWDAGHLRKARLVARDAEGEVLGWAALSPVSDRCVYGGVAEVSVYVGERGRGHGVGRALLESLIAASERSGIWTLQAGVFPENAASVKLHIGCGFREVGRRERIGKLHGVWRDTLLLERRSRTLGAS